MGMLETLLDPASRERAALDHARMVEKFGSRVPSHPAKHKFLFGQAREVQVLNRLAASSSDHFSVLLTQLAEGYAYQARFTEATTTTQDEASKKEYAEKADAINAIGVKRCQCPLFVVEPSQTDAKGNRVEVMQRIEEVFDGQKVIVFARCRLCRVVSAE